MWTAAGQVESQKTRSPLEAAVSDLESEMTTLSEEVDMRRRAVADTFVESVADGLVGKKVFVRPLRLARYSRPLHLDVVQVMRDGGTVTVSGVDTIELNRAPAYGLPEHVFCQTDPGDPAIGFVLDQSVEVTPIAALPNTEIS